MNVFLFVWPVAKAEEILATIVFIIIVVANVVGQLLNKVREAQKEAARRQGPAPAQPQAPQANDPLADEIGEFLRRATQRRQESAPPRAAPPAPAAAAARPARAPLAKLQERLSETRATERAAEAEEKRVSVAEHVQQRIGSRRFGPVGHELGKEVAQADEKLEGRLQRKFEHQLGRLAGSPGETSMAQSAQEPSAPADRISVPPAVTAEGLAAMFANPASLRHAILLYEVLRLPESRWS